MRAGVFAGLKLSDCGGQELQMLQAGDVHPLEAELRSVLLIEARIGCSPYRSAWGIEGMTMPLPMASRHGWLTGLIATKLSIVGRSMAAKLLYTSDVRTLSVSERIREDLKPHVMRPLLMQGHGRTLSPDLAYSLSSPPYSNPPTQCFSPSLHVRNCARLHYLRGWKLKEAKSQKKRYSQAPADMIRSACSLLPAGVVACLWPVS